MTNNKFMLGLAFGVVTGAITGMLLAPKSGKESRQAMKTRAVQLGSRTRRMMAKGKSTA